MKKFSCCSYLFFILLFYLFNQRVRAQGIGISAEGFPARSSAILDVRSTTKGMMVPTMLTSERIAISNPIQGLLVFDTQTNSFWFYNGGSWVEGSGKADFWARSGDNIYNTNIGKISLGITSGAGYLNIKAPLTAPYLLLSESGNYSSDYLAFVINPGTGTPTTRSGSLDATFGSPGGLTISNGANAPIRFSTNTNERMIITGNGNVGIGTVSPSVKLEIGTSNAEWGVVQNNGIVSVGTYITTHEGWVGTKTIHPLYFRAGLLFNTPPHMALLTNGFLGIGTSGPTAKLEVLTSDANYGIIHTNGIVSVGTYVGYDGGWVGTKSNHPLYFFTNNGNAVMTINASGNVGIGTILPTYKLSVNGNIRSKEVVVESGWADYVFDDHYKLPSLTDLEIFIKQNNHLPNIPSAREVQEKGLYLGDMQKKMMEKIEELTLYVIELKKEIESIKKRRE